jgi:hypothetical protein
VAFLKLPSIGPKHFEQKNRHHSEPCAADQRDNKKLAVQLIKLPLDPVELAFVVGRGLVGVDLPIPFLCVTFDNHSGVDRRRTNRGLHWPVCLNWVCVNVGQHPSRVFFAFVVADCFVLKNVAASVAFA